MGRATDVGEGSGRPTNIADVARLAGVSTGTVSNVLNNPHRVAGPTRERVQEVLRETGFVPNPVARRLSGAPSMTVGCVVTDLSNPYFADVTRGLKDALADLGCLAVTCGSGADPERERRYLQLLAEAGVRSVLLNSAEAQPDAARFLRRRGIPVTLLDGARSQNDLSRIGSDWITGGRLAADHLLDLGHRRIGLLRDDVDATTIEDRVIGMRQAAAARGLEPDQVCVPATVHRPGQLGDWAGVIEPLLTGPQPCTAFLCCDDLTALSLLKGLAEHGFDVPGDISVVGYDDRPFAGLLQPALTTVRPPAYRLGRAAARLALGERADAQVHRQTLLLPRLVVRGTSAPCDRTR